MGKANKGRSKPATKANGKVVHPNSRKAKKINKVAIRKDRLFEQAKTTNLAQYNQALKLRWFQEHLEPEKKCYANWEVVAMITSYLQEKAADVREIRESKAGVHKAVRLEAQYETEAAEFFSQKGFGAKEPDCLPFLNYIHVYFSLQRLQI
eukprot:TRINITY_DN7383_c0_g1_i2.p2 TRINITY_DN7383_c0_g1~~TRINITY_DN7383_c0_g1_i2.p2  ORF type:complete len:151 (+),score=22.06 TRINITY_DN7383_c0_g1_i2:113-565(+)